MKNIKNDIKTGEYKRAYLLYGTEDYLKMLYADKIKKALFPEEDSMNCTTFQGDGFDVHEFVGLCDTMPFFADKRLIIVNRSGLFKGSSKDGEDKKEDEEAGENEDNDNRSVTGSPKDILASYIKEIPETSVVVFVEDNVDKRSALYKNIKSSGYICELNEMSEGDLRLWIGSELKKNGKNITAATADYLMETVGTDMGALKQEIDKLSFYAMNRDSIVNADINAVCVKHVNAIIFNLTDALASGDRQKALKEYEGLVALREPVQKTFFMLLKHFTQMYVVKEMKKNGSARDEIAAVLKAHPFAVKKLMDQSGAFKLSQIQKRIEYGVNLEAASRAGEMSDKNIVELFIMAE